VRLAHDPQAVLDYAWDWSSWLLSGETIASFTLAITPNDGSLVIDSSSIAGDAVVAIISGGTVGAAYDVTCHVVSSGGREDDSVLSLMIRDQPHTASAMSVCEWPTVYPDSGPCGALASLPASGVARFEDMAAEFLWRYTGRRFGLCEGVIRRRAARLVSLAARSHQRQVDQRWLRRQVR
jgi:hypothetical protein